MGGWWVGRSVWLLPTWKTAFSRDREVSRWAAGEGLTAAWEGGGKPIPPLEEECWLWNLTQALGGTPRKAPQGAREAAFLGCGVLARETTLASLVLKSWLIPTLAHTLQTMGW